MALVSPQTNKCWVWLTHARKTLFDHCSKCNQELIVSTTVKRLSVLFVPVPFSLLGFSFGTRQPSNRKCVKDPEQRHRTALFRYYIEFGFHSSNMCLSVSAGRRAERRRQRCFVLTLVWDVPLLSKHSAFLIQPRYQRIFQRRCSGWDARLICQSESSLHEGALG